MAVLESSQRLISQGVACLTVCRPRSPLSSRLKDIGLPFAEIKAGSYLSPRSWWRFRRLLLSHHAEVVVCHFLKDLWIVRPALCGLNRIRLIGVSHMFLSVAKKDLFHRYLYGRLDRLICLTRTQKRNLCAHLPVPQGRYTVIPNGVDLTRFRSDLRDEAVRRQLGAQGGEILIGLVGRLDEQKGQIELVEAAAHLAKTQLRFHISIIGEETHNNPGMKALIEARIRELELQDRVTLAGFRADIPEVVASLDILVMPSYGETFGRVLLEAMASRTATLGTAAGGVPDIIAEGVTGLLVPPRNPQALAEALKRYIEDPELRRQIVETAYASVMSEYSQPQIDQAFKNALFAPS